MKISSPILMAYPGPPRRTAGVVRYSLLALALLSVLLYFRHSAQNAGLTSPFRIDIDPKPDPPLEGAPPTPENPIPQTPAPVDPPPPVVEPPVEEVNEPVVVDVPPAAQPPPAVEEPAVEEQQPPVAKPKAPPHPIDTLIEAAEKTFDDLLKKESHDLKTAAAVYRERRGRHPPPGFDVWFKFAQDNGAVMVEDFFDQIYHDLGPFWGLPPSTMRKEAWDYEMTINIRNHTASTGSEWFWTQIWLNLTKTIEHMLPDMDIALNAMDEPRVVAPWEDINRYMETERKTRVMAPAHEVISEFQHLALPGELDREVKTRDKEWEDTSKYWNRSVAAPLLTLPRAFLAGRLPRLSPRQSCSPGGDHVRF
jgi:hypothetical protein